MNGNSCLKAGALKLMRHKSSDERKLHAGMKKKHKRQVYAFGIYALNLEDRKFTVKQLKTLIAFKMNGSGHIRFSKTAKHNDLILKWPKVKTKNIPQISDPGEFEEAKEARNNLPTSTEAMEVLKGHEQCEMIQQMNSSGYADPSIVDGDDNLLDII